jgi:2-oxoglutarate ferredoxin oxidoreductase subunit alpha
MGLYNLLIGGAAGQGIDTTAAILEKLLKRAGYSVFTLRDFMSRIRGGHNFCAIRFGAEPVQSHGGKYDGMIALNQETVALHKDELKKDGFILCDDKLGIEDPRAITLNMEERAKALGNPRVAGSIAVGAVLKLFGENLDQAESVFREAVREQYLEVNMKAVQEGYGLTQSRYKHLAGAYGDWMLVSGSKALCLGALAAGLKFYSAYPMSPSTPILEYLAEKSREAGVVVEQAEDEIAGINMAIGASFAGARAMTGTSGGGFSLKVEALGLSGMAEVPLVVVDVQRPGPVTGLPTRTEQSDLKFVISASQGEFPRMVIALRDQEDSFYQTMRAFDIAERYQIPVILLSDQYLGDSTATVKPFDVSKVSVAPVPNGDWTGEGEYLRYQYTKDGISPRLLPGKAKAFVSADSDEHDERGHITESAEVRNRMMEKRMGKIEKLREELIEPEFIGSKKFETLLLGWGSLKGPITEAVETLNKDGKDKYAALVFGDIYPLPEKLLRKKAEKAKRIVNVEQNYTGQLAQLVREATGIVCDDAILKYDGRQLSGEEIAVLVEGRKEK